MFSEEAGVPSSQQQLTVRCGVILVAEKALVSVRGFFSFFFSGGTVEVEG